MKTLSLRFALAATLLATGPFALAGDARQDEDAAPPKEKFDDPVRAFQEVKDELLHNYYREDLTEADLYRAAVQGMLARVDPQLHAYNQLLSPSDYSELQIEMKGILMGIGVQIKFESATGVTEVLGVIPGSPAEKAGFQVGDQILAIDGTSFKGRSERHVVTAIRGREGDPVTLDVLRGTSIMKKTVARARIPVDAVSHQRFPGEVEVLTIHGFSERTPAALHKALGEIAQSGAKALVVDLRDNPGGLLEKAVECARLMLPRGTVIGRIVRRGKKVEKLVADQDPLVKPLPTAVLISSETMSSAELIAAALRDGLHAPLMGAKTRGKWSVQSLKELPNHYVMKYTVAVFQTADGQSYEGTGLPPDVEVAMEPAVLDRCEHVHDPAARMAADVQLRAAVNLLRMRP